MNKEVAPLASQISLPSTIKRIAPFFGSGFPIGPVIRRDGKIDVPCGLVRVVAIRNLHCIRQHLSLSILFGPERR
jgi:hypothetical protein